ncbi:MAG: FecR domain-containing protein [Proteobacteria bacterium]|nr:FecR domain-containing protein [Pseudomonadota bacterium]
MKKILFYTLFLLFFYTNQGICLEKLDFIHVISYEGNVSVKREEADDWIEIDLNMPITENDQIWVASKSKLELRIKNGSFVRLNEYTSLDVLYLSSSGYQFFSEGGDIYINYKSDYRSFLQFDTPSVTIKAYDNAKFRIEVFDDGETDVSVFDGEVVVTNKEYKITLKEKEKASFDENDILEKGKIYSYDDWEKWNLGRDKVFSEKSRSLKYLPDELHPYAYDFDSNGRWVYERDYGYVWQPTVIVIRDWAPYRHGYWVWIRGDYVWISLDPWGWVPYHYGRWVYSSRYGWLWVPPARGVVFWAPAYVGWVYFDDYICWVPLAPGEIYYGYGYFGPHSVNIINVNIKVTQIVYKNINVPNGFVVIHKNNFLTAKQIYEKVKENPFISRKVHVGRPSFDAHETRKIMVGKRLTQDDKKPPKFLIEKKIEPIKEKKPFILKETPERIKEEKQIPEKRMIHKDKEKRDFPGIREENKPAKKQEQQELKPIEQKKTFKKREKFKENIESKEKPQRNVLEKEKLMEKKNERDFKKDRD